MRYVYGNTLLSTLLVLLTACGAGLRGDFVPDTDDATDDTVVCSDDTTWATIDTYSANTSLISHGLTVDANTNDVYIAMQYTSTGGQPGRWITRKGEDGGTTWSDVDTFIDQGATLGARAYSAWVDPLGRIFIQGNGYTMAGLARWLTRVSSDNGASWSTIEDYVLSPGFRTQANFGSSPPVVANSGKWFVVGSGVDATGEHLIVRESSDQGTSWSNTYQYQYVAGQATSPRAMFRDSANNLYVAGQGDDGTGTTRWLVLKSADEGASWTIIDDYAYTVGQVSQPKGVYVWGSNILVTGRAVDGSSIDHWITRKSTDGGATWTQVDFVTDQSGAQSDPLRDHRGYLYIGGYIGATPNRFPTLRRSVDGGDTWTTVDQLPTNTASTSTFRALAQGPDYAVYAVAQTVATVGSTNHQVVRKLECQ